MHGINLGTLGISTSSGMDPEPNYCQIIGIALAGFQDIDQNAYIIKPSIHANR